MATSPLLYREIFKAKSKYNEKDGAVYAIALTDGSSTTTGVSAEWRADVFWQPPDAMDTLWPFEEDRYPISWNPDDPKMVVSGKALNPGAPPYLTTNYTASVSEYTKPGGRAQFDDSNYAVITNTPSRFLVRLAFEDEVRYLPIQAFERTDSAVATGRDVDRTARGGETHWLPSELEAGPLTNEVGLTDSNIPGYIYYRDGIASSERNWNLHLYHAPKL